MSAFLSQSGADVFPEARPSVIAATGAHRPLVLRETAPEPRPRARLEAVSADTNDAGAASRIASVLARFPKEVDAAVWPVHAA